MRKDVMDRQVFNALLVGFVSTIFVHSVLFQYFMANIIFDQKVERNFLCLFFERKKKHTHSKWNHLGNGLLSALNFEQS